MDRTLSYGLIGTIGLSASTISAAVVGQPFPVVVPVITAGAVIAGHHVRHGADDDAEADPDDPLDIKEGSA